MDAVRLRKDVYNLSRIERTKHNKSAVETEAKAKGSVRRLKYIEVSRGLAKLVQTQTIDAPHNKKGEFRKCQDIQDQPTNYLEIKK